VLGNHRDAEARVVLESDARRGPWSTSTCGCLRGERRADVRHGGRAARTELALGLHRLDPHCASAWSSLAATQARDRRA
jgi:hypothetical protein